jgi:hypothetical protein
MQTTNYILLSLAVVLLHVPLLIQFGMRMNRGIHLKPGEFVIVGFLLYYDIPILLECAGVPFQSPFFRPLFLHNERTILQTLGLLAIGPYLLVAGRQVYALIFQRRGQVQSSSDVSLSRFVWVALPPTILLTAFGLYAVLSADNIRTAKFDWLETLGPAYIVCLLPLASLSFVAARWNEMGAGRAWMLAMLVVGSILSTLFLGQRTLTLLPLLVPSLFLGRPRMGRFTVSAIVILLLAVGTAYYQKSRYYNRIDSPAELVLPFLSADLSRLQTLAESVTLAEPVGSRIMPRAFGGYAYAAALYVPRSLLPAKGYSTSAYLTAYLNGDDLQTKRWNLAIGFLEEIVLNAGLVTAIPLVFGYGMIFGLFEALCLRFSSARVPLSLAAIWFCGYGLPSLILYFGTIFVVCIGLELWVCRRTSDYSVASGYEAVSA